MEEMDVSRGIAAYVWVWWRQFEQHKMKKSENLTEALSVYYINE